MFYLFNKKRIDFSNGNTLDSFAFAANSILKTNVTQRGIDDLLMAAFDKMKLFESNFNFYRGGLSHGLYPSLVSIEGVAFKILPFYQYFFDNGYKP